MSFDVVASSRIERVSHSPWRYVRNMGLQLGTLCLAMAMVGILGLFNKRPIIVGELTLGYAAMGLIYLCAGVLVARRRLFPTNGQTILGGLLAGLLASAFLAALALVMSLVNLRYIFVALDQPLLKMLTFTLVPASLGIGLMLLTGAIVGAVGAILVLLPDRIRKPIAYGLIGAGLAGLFQELIRPILANSPTTKPLHDLIYTWTGLTQNGAIIIFVFVAVITIIWGMIGGRVTHNYQALPATTRKRIRWGYLAAGALLLVLFPLFAGNFIGQIMLTVALFTLMGMGLNLEVGLAGLLDLGFVAFYAVGAYVTGLLMADSPFALAHLFYWEAMPIAVLCSVCMGIIFGIPVLKVRGDYLAVATLGLGEIVRVIVLSDAAAPLLAGAKGILQIPRPQIGEFHFSTPVSLFYLALVASLIAAYCAWRLEDSRLGRAWKAIRDDEDVAQALGINLIQVKLLAYGLGAAFAGLAGSIFAVMLGSIYPHSFQLIISINILALIIVGGMGSLPGVAVGAAVLIGLPEVLREFGEFRYLFYGLAIILVMRIKPEGLWPSAAKRREMQIDAEVKAEQVQDIAEARA
ncbi:branched-chain amino acid transport system permease protein [Rhodoligotrophos appendicifer]|uniref:branched-chain amino acid ABC transporter permease n=1 Tax=Rhodoligotrophos appendicifer TaxID=987056 RepID=UPI001186F974|nr:branched-chain amino acid ABC transporter permease [Rhodoligotrophos appendicifer]